MDLETPIGSMGVIFILNENLRFRGENKQIFKNIPPNLTIYGADDTNCIIFKRLTQKSFKHTKKSKQNTRKN